MTRTKRSFGEADRAELLALARQIRRQSISLLARLPINGEHYKATSDLLEATNRLLAILGAEDWHGRNSIGQNGG